MKEYQLRHSLGKTIAFSFCVWVSVAGFFSCDSDRLNGGGSIGMMSLNLTADTTNIKGGALSTKAGNVLEDFEDVDEYMVQIFQESDTLTSSLYKDVLPKVKTCLLLMIILILKEVPILSSRKT